MCAAAFRPTPSLEIELDEVGFCEEWNQDKLVEVFYSKVVKLSDKAILLIIDDEEVWLPRSQITEMTEETVTVTKWIADEKGLDGV